ncbi:MAG: GreA/GreB family elongation factor [Deltaproteobacteria bacterium]|nr:GreA/GreB family elongation factor [Deltaproteobacteria bacterium]MBW2417184.1 GreA/GreB family elongation factor [Deltaproteobacteria bacterium]
MVSDRKAHFVEELRRHYRELISGAHRAESDAGEAADQIQREARRREDSKSAVEAGRMAAGHRQRRQRAKEELESLISFAAEGLRELGPRDAVGLGALVDVSIETDEGSEERTFFVLPVGAGTELHGPGGDGFVSVITPASPVGRALQGARAGDQVEVLVRGRDREWTVVDLC